MKRETIVTLLLICLSTVLSFGQTTIAMQKEGGVYVVPCTVNGLKLKFIFDTGASDVSISLTEARFMLKNGYLKSEDILQTQYFSDATGQISAGRKIILRNLEFAGYKLTNVSATVVNQLAAPLLLGQSAMSKLGKFQFDPKTGILTVLRPQTKNTSNNSIKENINYKNFIAEKTPEVDFGDVNQGDSAYRVVSFINNSGNDLTITGGRASRGCILVIYPKETIQDNEAFDIKIIYGTNVTGSMHGIITLDTDCKNQSLKEIYTKGFVAKK